MSEICTAAQLFVGCINLFTVQKSAKLKKRKKSRYFRRAEGSRWLDMWESQGSRRRSGRSCVAQLEIYLTGRSHEWSELGPTPPGPGSDRGLALQTGRNMPEYCTFQTGLLGAAVHIPPSPSPSARLEDRFIGRCRNKPTISDQI